MPFNHIFDFICRNLEKKEYKLTSLSIIIVNYKSWLVLEKCLKSILSQDLDDIEVIIIDNNSNDDLITKFKKKYTNFKWISNKINAGFSKACNQGAKIAKNQYYLFLNPDTELEKNCLVKLKSNINNFPNSILSISQLDTVGNIRFPYGSFLSIRTFNGIIRFLDRLFSLENRKIDNKKLFIKPNWVSGSFLLIDNKNFNKLSGWDEDYWMYYEDMDLCKRAINIGIDIVLINSTSCTHHHGKSSKVNLKTRVKAKTHSIKSGVIFIEKHYSGAYQKILKFLYLSSRIIELLILSPFSKVKRLIFFNLIFNYR